MKKLYDLFFGLLFVIKSMINCSKKKFIILITGSFSMAIGFVWLSRAEKEFFDSINNHIINRNDTYVIKTFIIFLLSYVFVQSMIHITNGTEEIFYFQIKHRLEKTLGEKCSNIDLILFQDSNFLDMLDKAKKGKEGILTITFSIISLLFYYIPYFILLSIWLFIINPLLVLAIPLAFIPSVITYIIQIKAFSKVEDESAELRRKLESYENNLIGTNYIKETRVLGCTAFLFSLYKDIAKMIYDKEFNVYNHRQYTNIILKVIHAAGYIGILLMTLIFVIKGKISVGAFAAIFSSLDALFSTMDEAISRQFGSISEEYGTVENYVNFICANFPFSKSRERGGGLKLSNVSFTYPNSEHKVLENISLNINEGETIAIVGKNGSGKSTLTKILLGLYRPTEGNIEYSKSNEKTAVFQDYMKYSMTLKENIVISDYSNEIEEKIRKALKYSRLNCSKEKFPKGYNTLLAKEYGGVDLSGGEWQKVAIARGIYKDYNYIVFDEPTASIDPFEESSIYNSLNEFTKSKTAIIVTHRMGTVKLADKIVVLKDGKIVGVGTHNNLIKCNEEYRNLYLAQSEKFEK